jgi:hypothetical protein
LVFILRGVRGIRVTDEKVRVVIRGGVRQNLHPLEIRSVRVCREGGSEVARDIGFRVTLLGRAKRA